MSDAPGFIRQLWQRLVKIAAPSGARQSASAPSACSLQAADLSEEKAGRGLLGQGPNELADRDRHGLLNTLRGAITELMLLLLMAASIYLVLGELSAGPLLAFFAVLTVALVIFQGRGSEHALAATTTCATQVSPSPAERTA